MNIRIKRLNQKAVLPSKGSTYAAGYDLYACIPNGREALAIDPHKTCRIGTGWAFEIPEGYFGAIFARSGLATRQGLRPANCVGVIDSDYRGEIQVALHNDTNIMQCITEGERIAQLVILPVINIDSFETIDELEDLEETERGEGGFGSTGK